MSDLFGLFDESEAEKPPPPERPAPSVQVQTDKPAPTLRSHLCVVVGCRRWGCYGLMGSRIEGSTWYCVEHRPEGFLTASGAARLATR